jgi:hypothetical protein
MVRSFCPGILGRIKKEIKKASCHGGTPFFIPEFTADEAD